MRILLVRLRPVGDVVFTTPLLSALRRHYSEAHIAYVVEPDAALIVEGNPHINELIVAPRRRGLARIADDIGMARRLARGRYDVAIDLHGGPRSAWFTWASRARKRIGYRIPGRAWMYTEAVARSQQLTPRHSVMNQWDLLAPLGVPPLDCAREPVEMPENEQAARRVEAELAASGVGPQHTVIVIHVSASNRFKRWPEESFVSLVVALVRQDQSRRVILTAGPSDLDATRRIARAARSHLGAAADAVIEDRLAGLAELRALIARAHTYVGGDSGPLHVAATTRVPIVELLGPTLAERSHPWRDPRWFTEIIDPGALPCRPCHQRVCVPGDFRCLTSTGPERVIAATERALASKPSSQPGIPAAVNERRIPVVHR
ncbi:MAG TPA: glycosyltransferase family 9 protein [Vicinamibacterales bacterium]|nr:glycosyltransferase family 9 protein [Vicinamibacterales bacterium]